MAEIPDYQTLMLPVLRAAVQGETTVPRVIDEVAEEYGLTDDQLAKPLPSGGQTLMANRTHWARTYLMKAGLLEAVRRGVFKATERGREVLSKHPTRVDNKVLSQFPEFIAFLNKRNTEVSPKQTLTEVNTSVIPEVPANGSGTPLEDSLQATAPDEQIDKAVKEIELALREELLDRIFAIEPVARRALFFERLVLRLLVAMDYGLGEADHLGGRGDGGVDGVIYLDALGLDRVYIQAKCYDREVLIQPSQVRDFSGSLDDKKTTRGVFITTAKFSRASADYVKGIQKQIILIDGEELAQLMIRHQVGVRVDRIVQVKKLDEDTFDE
ncbi:restriction endonuclease [Bradyrhizobium diazoefficiens]|nr:restriction endonuclease [Bradyrhizobium diazoefficiens]MBR0775331.1 restriction endonuclease [Bradyrhizobium diazoefficiens]